MGPCSGLFRHCEAGNRLRLPALVCPAAVAVWWPATRFSAKSTRRPCLASSRAVGRSASVPVLKAWCLDGQTRVRTCGCLACRHGRLVVSHKLLRKAHQAPLRDLEACDGRVREGNAQPAPEPACTSCGLSPPGADRHGQQADCRRRRRRTHRHRGMDVLGMYCLSQPAHRAACQPLAKRSVVSRLGAGAAACTTLVPARRLS